MEHVQGNDAAQHSSEHMGIDADSLPRQQSCSKSDAFETSTKNIPIDSAVDITTMSKKRSVSARANTYSDLLLHQMRNAPEEDEKMTPYGQRSWNRKLSLSVLRRMWPLQPLLTHLYQCSRSRKRNSDSRVGGIRRGPDRITSLS